MVRHGASKTEGVFLKIAGPWTARVAEVRDRAKDFVDLLKMGGAGAEELAVALVSIVAELEQEANARRKR